MQAEDEDDDIKLEYADYDDGDDDDLYVPEQSASSEDEEYFEIEFLEDDEDAKQGKLLFHQHAQPGFVHPSSTGAIHSYDTTTFDTHSMVTADY